MTLSPRFFVREMSFPRPKPDAAYHPESRADNGFKVWHQQILQFFSFSYTLIDPLTYFFEGNRRYIKCNIAKLFHLIWQYWNESEGIEWRTLWGTESTTSAQRIPLVQDKHKTNGDTLLDLHTRGGLGSLYQPPSHILHCTMSNNLLQSCGLLTENCITQDSMCNAWPEDTPRRLICPNCPCRTRWR